MRRLRDRRPAGLFRGGELPRLLSLIVMLFVLAMMMRKARDEDTWRFFTGDSALARQGPADEPPSPDRRQHRRPSSQATEPTVVRSEPVPAGPAQTATVVRSATAERTAALAVASIAAEPSSAEPISSDSRPLADDEHDATAAPAAAEPSVASEGPPAPNPAPAHLDRPHLPARPDVILDPNSPPPKPQLDEGPLDENAEERSKFEYESQALSDRAPLAQEEMMAYWRLLKWANSQSALQMRERARGDVRYGALIEHPEDYRGELIKVRLHIRRLLREEAPPDIPLPIHTYYEAQGVSDASQSWFYFCIFSELPEGMAVGDFVNEEGTFIGYFLKAHVYQDGKGTRTKAPILIGRMIYHPAPAVERNTSEWMWPWIVGGVLAGLYALRWGWRLRGGRPARPSVRGLLRREPAEGPKFEGANIEDWLAQATDGAPGKAINSPPEHDLKDSAHAEDPRPRVDWTEEAER